MARTTWINVKLRYSKYEVMLSKQFLVGTALG